MKERHPYTLADLQAFVDGEGSEAQRSALINHMTTCNRCRKKLDDMIQTTRFIEERLAFSLSQQRSPVPLVNHQSVPADGPEHLDAAWQRFLSRVSGTPMSPRWNSLLNPKESVVDQEVEAQDTIQSVFENKRTIPAVTEHPAADGRRVSRLRIRGTVAMRTLAAAAGTVLLIGALTTDIGNRALAAMLHTFRMEHLVGVGEDSLAEFSRAMEQAGTGTIDLRQYGKIEHRGGGPSRESTVAEALRSVGYPVKALPGSDPAQSKATLEPSRTITFYLKADKVNDLIRRMGGHAELPNAVDGQPITLTIPAVVTQWERSNDDGDRWRELVQLRAPQLDVPPQVDTEEVRRVLTDLPFLPNEVRQRIAGTEDWKQTLFIPMPGQVRNLSVEGREAVLSSSEHSRTLLWLEGGYLYQLSGSNLVYPTDEAILREAKVIMGS